MKDRVSGALALVAFALILGQTQRPPSKPFAFAQLLNVWRAQPSLSKSETALNISWRFQIILCLLPS